MSEGQDQGGPPRPPRPGERVAAWLQRTRTYSWPRFLVEATIVAILLRIPVVWITVPILGEDARTAYDWLDEYTVGQMALLALVLGPVVETVFAQWLPIALGRHLFGSDGYAVLLSAWLFAWLHYPQGLLLVVIMFTTGLVLAWTFAVWRARGPWAAFLMTTAVHSALNGVALAAALLAPEVPAG